MKDFDVERRERNHQRERELGDRTFTLCGETFTYRSSISYTVLAKIATTSDLEGADLIDSMEAAAIELLEPDQEERFRAVVRNTADPVTFADLNDLVTWMTERQVGRPTSAPLPSTSGAPKTATPSTEGSSSQPAVASAA